MENQPIIIKSEIVNRCSLFFNRIGRKNPVENTRYEAILPFGRHATDTICYFQGEQKLAQSKMNTEQGLTNADIRSYS